MAKLFLLRHLKSRWNQDKEYAVGIGADFIKAGAYTKEERVVKYNRLLEIESELGKS